MAESYPAEQVEVLGRSLREIEIDLDGKNTQGGREGEVEEGRTMDGG